MKIGIGSKIYETAKILQEGHEITIGNNCLIGDFAFVAARKLVMEDGSQVSPHAILGGGGNIYLGKYAVVGFGAMLIPASDSPAGKYMCEAKGEEDRKIVRGSILLDEGAYIGSGAVICVNAKHPNIRIGKRSVVGALTYVDRSISANLIVHAVVKQNVSVRADGT